MSEEGEEMSVHTMKKASSVAKLGMIGFGFTGVAFLYLYIALLDVAVKDKVLYAAVLTIALAFLFLGLYSIIQDSIRAAERANRRRRPRSD
jgi:O-antigen/teichoic acid export membrane protein